MLLLTYAPILLLTWVEALDWHQEAPRLSSPRSVNDRVDCFPDASTVDQADCLERGCLFDDSVSSSANAPPACFYPDNFGYHLFGGLQETEFGFTGELVKSGPAIFVPNEFNIVSFQVEYQTDTRLRIKIQPNVPRYEVPIAIEKDPIPPINRMYDVQFSYEPVFSFRVVRKSSGEILFDSSLGGLSLAEQLLQVGFRIPTENLYGFGEHEHHSLMHNMTWKTWGMFASDRPPNSDIALYGVHPHYTVVESDGNAHSVLFLNSNAQEVTLTPSPGIVYRTIGGILDMYFFLGPTPEEVVSQYTAALGRHPMPPYWSLGFHICRWGYDTLENMEAAYNRTIEAGIPLDGQWADIDALERNLDFTYNTDNFTNLPQYINKLHQSERNFVIIVDPGISSGETPGSYPPYDQGQSSGVWILNNTGLPLLGSVWPDDPVCYPDFTHPETENWWSESIGNFYNSIPFDGLWIDMNEPSNFAVGSVDGCEGNNYNDPPYLPKIDRNTINRQTICMDSFQHGGLHYNLHSMYGFHESIATFNALKSTLDGKRGIVLSRSTFPGSGKYASHWLGDNWSQWNNLKYSIIGSIEMNQFGIPLVGADICGFAGPATEQMCARWQLLGAFYPFSRNHNMQGWPDQDPGMWPTVAENARKALRIRYSLLPYLYTLFYHHATNGNTVMRPLWHEFPTDSIALTLDEQFLWGSNFLICPALERDQTSVQVYFPDGQWFDYFTKALISTSSGYQTFNCELDCILLYVRGGSILPTQAPEMTTAQTRRNNFELIVALDSVGFAFGDLYWDDGITEDETFDQGSHISFTHQGRTLSSNVLAANYFELANYAIEKISIWGVTIQVQSLSVNSGAVSCSWNQDNATLDIDCGQQLSALTAFTMTYD